MPARRTLTYAACEILFTAAVILAAWRYTEHAHSFAVARFGDVWTQFHTMFLFDRIGTDVVPTLRRVALGFGLSVILGFGLGLALGHSRVLRLVTGPLLAFVRAVPPVALIPPAIILIGVQDNMKILLTTFVCLWPVALNTADGVLEIHPTITDTGDAFQLSRADRMRYLVLPAIAPRVFAGMQISLALALISVIATEYLAGTEGIGFIINQAQQSYLIPQMWAGIVMLGLIGYLLNLGFSTVRRRVLYWIPPVEAGRSET